jgi:3-oxoacyl-[acyl-carrier-protein] synthase II
MNRVVVTGIGLVTPCGVGTEESFRAVVQAESGIAPITLFDATGFSTTFAGEVKGFDPTPFIPRKKLKEMGRFAHLAIAASRMALDGAGFASPGAAPGSELTMSDADREACGTFLGVGLGGLERLYDDALTLAQKGPGKLSPYFIPAVIANLAAGQVAIAFGLEGPSYSNTSACASSAHAIGEAFEWIRRGRTPLMLAGGSEATITGLGIGGFNAMFALSRRNDDPARASRPWDVDRDGFVCAEGAGVLVLESLEHAKARGARIHAEILGYGATCDAYHLTKPAPDGRGAQKAMRQALADARLDPADVDYVNAHGTSTPAGDLEEARAAAAVFGDHAIAADRPVNQRLWMSSTKGCTGHLLGGAGGVEAAFTALALERGVVPPTANLERVDPACPPIELVPREARERSIRRAMSNSFGFGGTNASLVLGRFEG